MEKVEAITEQDMDLGAYRYEFPVTERCAFLNHASVATYNRRLVAALTAHAEQMRDLPFDHLLQDLLVLTEDFKERVASLIGAARPDEIVPMQGAGVGINTAAYSLPLAAGDNVLVLQGDYPANVYPWLNLASRGVLVKFVPQRDGGLDLDLLEARIDNRTRAVALSSAMFATGFKNDLCAAGELCRSRGIYFVVDGIQTLGAMPLDVQECRIDFLACGSQKWLLGAPGSGFLYCRHELLDELQPGAYVGAFSTLDPWNFLDYNFTLQSSSERFTVGTPNIPGLVALHASLELLLEVGIDKIARRIRQLTDILIEDLQARGYRILSNLAPEHRTGIVIVDAPEPVAAYQKLLAANVITSARGAGLRVSPHFYNSEADVLRVGEVLGDRRSG